MKNSVFKYLDSNEVRNLSIFDFVTYCEGVMSELDKCAEGELCRAKDDFMMLKNIEDKYISFCLKKVYEDSGFRVIGFRFDFDLPVNDADFVKGVEHVGSIVLDSNRNGYVIYDTDGIHIPFSYVNAVGIVLRELLLKVRVFYENKDNLIESDID